MGYTHYWKFKKNPKDVKDGYKKFKSAVELLKSCLEKVPKELDIERYDYKTNSFVADKVPLILKGSSGEGEPIFDGRSIIFNGDASSGYDHESFYITLDDDDDDFEFNFCKTARKPYDVAVCLALLCLKKEFDDDFSYSSDGTIDNYGWELAIKIFNETAW